MVFEGSKYDINAKNLIIAFTIGYLADSIKNLKISLAKWPMLYCAKRKNDVYTKQVFYANTESMKLDVVLFASKQFYLFGLFWPILALFWSKWAKLCPLGTIFWLFM